jgi:hypothetical protein
MNTIYKIPIANLIINDERLNAFHPKIHTFIKMKEKRKERRKEEKKEKLD